MTSETYHDPAYHDPAYHDPADDDPIYSANYNNIQNSYYRPTTLTLHNMIDIEGVLIPTGLLCDHTCDEAFNTGYSNAGLEELSTTLMSFRSRVYHYDRDEVMKKLGFDFRRQIMPDGHRETLKERNTREKKMEREEFMRYKLEQSIKNQRLLAHRDEYALNPQSIVPADVAIYSSERVATILIGLLRTCVLDANIADIVMEYLAIPQLEPFKVGDLVRVIVDSPYIGVQAAIILDLTATEAIIKYCYGHHMGVKRIRRTMIVSHLYTDGDYIYFTKDSTTVYGQINFMRWDGNYNVSIIRALPFQHIDDRYKATTIIEKKSAKSSDIIIHPKSINGMILTSVSVWRRSNNSKSMYITRIQDISQSVYDNSIVFEFGSRERVVISHGLIPHVTIHTIRPPNIVDHTAYHFPLEMQYNHNYLMVGDFVKSHYLNMVGEQGGIVCAYPINHKVRDVKPIPIQNEDGTVKLFIISEEHTWVETQWYSLINGKTKEPLDINDIFIGALVSLHSTSRTTDDRAEAIIGCVLKYDDNIVVCQRGTLRDVPIYYLDRYGYAQLSYEYGDND
jgi:hypothetical protein